MNLVSFFKINLEQTLQKKNKDKKLVFSLRFKFFLKGDAQFQIKRCLSNKILNVFSIFT